MTRHKAAGQTLVAGELREALRVGGESVMGVETGESVEFGDGLDDAAEPELDALRTFVADISAGGYTKAQIVKQAKQLSAEYGLDA